jgi:hypothetical protein
MHALATEHNGWRDYTKSCTTMIMGTACVLSWSFVANDAAQRLVFSVLRILGAIHV